MKHLIIQSATNGDIEIITPDGTICRIARDEVSQLHNAIGFAGAQSDLCTPSKSFIKGIEVTTVNPEEKPTMDTLLNKLVAEFNSIADECDAMVAENNSGGWSTNLNQRLTERANQCRRIAANIKDPTR